MFKIKDRKRTVRSWVYSVIGIAVLLVTIIGGLSTREQVTKSWYTTAVVSQNNADVTTTSVSEIIDTDFASTDQRGIWREIPDVSVVDNVFSPYAPDDLRILDDSEIAKFNGGCSLGTQDSCLVIGNPNKNNYGIHRYIIDYQFEPNSISGGKDSRCGLTRKNYGTKDRITVPFCWIAVPQGWEWKIDTATIQIKHRKRLIEPECSVGTSDPNNFSSNSDDCQVTQNGSITIVTASNLDSDTGVWVRAKVSTQDAYNTADFLPPPKAPSQDDGKHPVSRNGKYILLAAVLALIGKLIMTQLILLRGRDIVRSGGATEAAFADNNEGPTKTLSNAALRKLVTLSVVPPEGITPYHGAILVNEEVTKEAKQAWFLSQVLDGKIEMVGKSGTQFKYVSKEPLEKYSSLRYFFGHEAHLKNPVLDLT